MPYIITTTDPYGDSTPAVTSRAVATLDEARESARDEVERTPMTAVDETRLMREAMSLAESGGTIGPLADGAVICVDRVTWDELRIPRKTDGVMASGSQILRAFNGRGD